MTKHCECSTTAPPTCGGAEYVGLAFACVLMILLVVAPLRQLAAGRNMLFSICLYVNDINCSSTAPPTCGGAEYVGLAFTCVLLILHVAPSLRQLAARRSIIYEKVNQELLVIYVLLFMMHTHIYIYI